MTDSRHPLRILAPEGSTPAIVRVCAIAAAARA